MKHLAVRSPRLIEPSPALRRYIDQCLPRLSRDYPPLPAHLTDEARRLAAAVEAESRDDASITPEAMLVWLAPLCLSVGNPPTKEDMEDRAVAAAWALAGVHPARLFDQRAMQIAMLRCKFWPTVPEIAEVAEIRANERDGYARVMGWWSRIQREAGVAAS
jgi:hypothetical protein